MGGIFFSLPLSLFCNLIGYNVYCHELIIPLLHFHEDGILLLEVNRMLRGGGYFVWAAQPVYKHEPILEEQWEGKLLESALLMLSSFFMKKKRKREILICWELRDSF